LQVKKFLPFADGPRSCVGLSMGQMAYMAAMARLLSNFHFKLHPSVHTLLLVVRNTLKY
jgi:cytochrome P450 family 6